ncbi:TetR/AcrR family transcriptional regulator [Marinomonas sp. GJ51-6]|uniref:acrylate utilization transcriptional regulator AcuR n=1 Tax=Marinomonas sp. GJ51-6 TaxID=2992802 RepID=UPI002934F4F8|nr:TetR/AcrR family transcriptional regulator [Marinomonas sp. GJ51-6]WOD08929.1 TetR/AcrR family transcriptional regulator [Marinomonas sp. GJ51-6]
MSNLVDETQIMSGLPSKPRRGRPKKQSNDTSDTRESLLRAGMQILTETGFMNSGIDPILKSVGVPKGSFYHYFSSKEAFGIAVLERYSRYFENKLDKFLLDDAFTPLERLRNFAQDAENGIIRHDFKRGCLVGNLEQESILLSDIFRQRLQETYLSWQNRVADCLAEGQKQKEVTNEQTTEDMSQIFWIGWEGAVHRARLVKSTQPLSAFLDFFIHTIQQGK